jgi:hypothetical protein
MDLERCSQKITATSREAAVLKIEQDWGKGLPARRIG